MAVRLSPRAALATAAVACSGMSSFSPPQSTATTADIIEPPVGIADRGNDPAVVLIDVANVDVCAGALVASDVVLTAAHCVAAISENACSAADAPAPVLRSAETMGVRREDASPFEGARVGVQSIVASPTLAPCAADLAILLLRLPIVGVAPLSVRTTGIAAGDHVRSVGYGRLSTSEQGTVEIVRDNVAVGASSASQFLLDEAACQDGCGGPVIDETSGDIVGVLSRGSPGSSAFDLATRTDSFLALIAQGLRMSVSANATPASSGARTKKGPIDLGSVCISGSDCAAGVCVTAGSQSYCSRTCEPRDRCPTDFRCEALSSGVAVCVQT